MYTLSLFLLALFSLYIGVFFLLGGWEALPGCGSLTPFRAQILFVLVFALFLLAALLLIRRVLEKLDEKSLRRLALFCIIFLAAGQLLFLALIQPQLRYDPLKIFDMAVEMLRTHTISGTYETGYFAPYNEQLSPDHPDLLVPASLSRLGIPQAWFMPAVQLVNIVCITLSIWLGYLIMKELKGRRAAVFYLAALRALPAFLRLGPATIIQPPVPCPA